MEQFERRALTALALAFVAEAIAYSFKMLNGLPPLAILAPLLAGLGGWWLLYAWREQAGMHQSGPIFQYALIVLGLYALFGILFTPAGQSQPLTAALTIALLLPALGEFVRDYKQFKSEPEPEGEAAEY